jgi:hypothetical protein
MQIIQGRTQRGRGATAPIERTVFNYLEYQY